MATKRVRVGDVELAVTDTQSGPPLLLVHGFPLDHTMWNAQIQGLSSDYRVIAPDLRGFGASDVTPGTVTMEQMADDLAGLLSALEIAEPVVFCGLSMGGYVGWQFWRRHAARVRALILCDTRSIADTPEGAEARGQLAEKVLAAGPAAVTAAMIPKLFGQGTAVQRAGLLAGVERVILANPREGIAAALRGMAVRSDATDLLKQISVPTLVLVGEEDAISPPDEMRRIADAIPGAKFEIIPGAGHMAPLEQPGLVNEKIRAFLSAIG